MQHQSTPTQKHPRKSLEEAFWSKVEKTDGCWIWRGRLNHAGYGYPQIHGRCYTAHRLAYILTYGPISDNLLVCHRCDVLYPPGNTTYRRCVRPDHMFLGSHLDNQRDMVAKGRAALGARNGNTTHPECRREGEKNPAAKLSASQVVEIRRRYAQRGVLQRELAAEFGVTQTMVKNIVTRKAWDHLADGYPAVRRLNPGGRKPAR